MALLFVIQEDDVAHPLPQLRAKIQKSFLILVSLYAALGLFMMVSVFLASGISPKLIHVNYDSIAAASRMLEAWNELDQGSRRNASRSELSQWKMQFEDSLRFAENNATEPGEAALLKEIRAAWIQQDPIKPLLRQLVEANEKGMFRLAEESTRFGKRVFWASVAFFILTLVFALIFAHRLADRLARPLRELAEILRNPPSFQRTLILPKPATIEMKILNQELSSLWSRLQKFQQTNIQELAIQRERLQTILASVEDALLVLDHLGNILHVSDGMAKILGQAAESLISQPWSNLSERSENSERLKNWFSAKNKSDEAIELNVQKETRAYTTRCREMTSAEDRKIGVLYILQDVTEERNKEKLKNEFIGVLSHELKTPVQSLGTAGELLMSRKNQLPEDCQMLVETIHEDVARIRSVANDFMQVGMTDLRSLKLRFERHPLNQLVQDWLKPFTVLARSKSVDVEFIQEGSPVIWANLDTVKLPWAISNLLANAIRVSGPGKKVTVFMTDRSPMAEIEIRDEGPGISEHVQKRMFEPYFQAPAGDAGSQSGSLGLGLTIAKEVVEAHGGLIDYFPRKPYGSTFRISMPYVIPFGPLTQE